MVDRLSRFVKVNKNASKIIHGNCTAHERFREKKEDRPNLFTSFLNCLQTALCCSGYHNIILKVKEVICLKYLFLRKDLLVILPTGYCPSGAEGDI